MQAMQEFDDRKLLILLKKGSLEAYELLFKKYYKVLCLQANHLLENEVEAEDLVQELFIAFWDKKIYRQVEHSLKAYLYRSVRNKCINKIQKLKVLKQKKQKYKAFSIRKQDATWVDDREFPTGIYTVLKEFPPQRLRAFTLVYMENKKYREAAEEMGVSINSVKTHLKLALQVLREKLEIS